MPSDLATAGWLKASRSAGQGDCVEVMISGQSVLIRDSKYLRDPANNPAVQPIISVSIELWPIFLSTVQCPVTPAGLPVVAHTPTGTTLTDTAGTTLSYTPSEWDAFLDGASNGEFDLTAQLAA